LIVRKKNKKIICVSHARGRVHDFKLYQKSKIKINKKNRLDADSGYLGIEKIHENVHLPKKSSKLHPLTEKEKKYNKKHSSGRVVVEHVIRKIKIFKIMADKYRNRRRRYNLRMQLLCGIYNYGITK
jgi:hypothetical protein